MSSGNCSMIVSLEYLAAWVSFEAPVVPITEVLLMDVDEFKLVVRNVANGDSKNNWNGDRVLVAASKACVVSWCDVDCSMLWLFLTDDVKMFWRSCSEQINGSNEFLMLILAEIHSTFDPISRISEFTISSLHAYIVKLLVRKLFIMSRYDTVNSRHSKCDVGDNNNNDNDSESNSFRRERICTFGGRI